MESVNLLIESQVDETQLANFKHSFEAPPKNTPEARQEYMRRVVAGLAACKQESDRALT